MSRVFPVAFLGAVLALLVVFNASSRVPGELAAEETDEPYYTPTSTMTPTPAVETSTPSPTLPVVLPPGETPLPIDLFEPQPELVIESEATAYAEGGWTDLSGFVEEYVRVPRAPAPQVYSFEELQAQIDVLLAELPGLASVALLRPGEGVVFARDEGRPYRLASVAKLYILAAYLDRLAFEEREPDEFEYSLLEAMISYSDNDAAEYLWELLGGPDSMLAYLNSRGFYDYVPADDRSWGGAADTPTEVAAFLEQLTAGVLLDPVRTGLALSLLGLVADTQRWGVPAGVQAYDPDATVLVKDGWYPEYEGWLVNSAGVVIPAGGAAPYIFVILGEGFLYYEDGVDALEAIAQMANGLMLRPLEQAFPPASDVDGTPESWLYSP